MSDPIPTGLAVDSRRVVHETIDGEVILIQLETGYYYSLDGVGAEIWAMLVRAVPPAEIARAVGDAHGALADAAVFGLLHDLHAEALIAHEGSADALAELALAADADGLPKPQLCKYTDMEDFMLVDPVHEADETGWPNRAATTS